MDFDEYVTAQRPALMRFATVLCGETWLAEDLVSDSLGRAYERWPHIGTLDLPHAYVRRMVLNDYLSWRRRRQRTVPVDDLGHHLDDVADGTGDRAERDAMITRLARLPRRQRAAVVLRFYLGLSDDEIADELGCRPSTVRSQISRGLSSLRVELTADTTDHPATPAPSLETR